MCGEGTCELSDAAFLDVEALEAEQLFLEARELFHRELAHEELLSVGRVAGVASAVLDFCHASVVPCGVDAEALAEVESVHPHLFAHDDHDVVGGLVVDEQLAVAVGDGSACRELCPVHEGVGVCPALEVVGSQLEEEEPCDVNRHDDDSRSPQHILASDEFIVCHVLLRSLI